jgi:hypothetical protein
MLDKRIVVNGIGVTLSPYSEKRYKMFMQVEREIRDHVNELQEKDPESTIHDIPMSKKAEWWKRKADILWQPDSPMNLDFFESDEFESSLLKDTENFFFANMMYL